MYFLRNSTISSCKILLSYISIFLNFIIRTLSNAFDFFTSIFCLIYGINTFFRYDSDKDSYCSLVEWEEFKKNYNKYIDPQIKSNTISMSLPFVSEEDKVKENDIYLRMGTTNQLELIMLDSAGRIQRYYIYLS